MVEAGLRVYWEAEARRRGVIVVSPVAPGGKLYFKGSERHIPEFLRLLQKEFAVADGTFHLTGVSNGGVAAFRVALLYPEFFQSLTVLPGFPPTPAGRQYFGRLSAMRIAMFVGEHDDGFREPMELAQQAFAANGKDIHMEILADEGHFVRSLSGANAAKLFDRILK
jgi:predicted esterase